MSNQAQTKSDAARQMQVIGGLEGVSLSDYPRDQLKR